MATTTEDRDQARAGARALAALEAIGFKFTFRSVKDREHVEGLEHEAAVEFVEQFAAAWSAASAGHERAVA